MPRRRIPAPWAVAQLAARSLTALFELATLIYFGHLGAAWNGRLVFYFIPYIGLSAIFLVDLSEAVSLSDSTGQHIPRMAGVCAAACDAILGGAVLLAAFLFVLLGGGWATPTTKVVAPGPDGVPVQTTVDQDPWVPDEHVGFGLLLAVVCLHTLFTFTGCFRRCRRAEKDQRALYWPQPSRDASVAAAATAARARGLPVGGAFGGGGGPAVAAAPSSWGGGADAQRRERRARDLESTGRGRGNGAADGEVDWDAEMRAQVAAARMYGMQQNFPMRTMRYA